VRALLKESGDASKTTPAPTWAKTKKPKTKDFLAAEKARSVFARRKPPPKLDVKAMLKKLMEKKSVLLKAAAKAHTGEDLHEPGGEGHKGAIGRYRELQRKAQSDKRPHSAAFHGHMASMLEGGHARVSGSGPSEQIHYRKGADMEAKHKGLFSKLTEERKARPPKPRAPQPSAPGPKPPSPAAPKIDVPKVAPKPKVPQPQAPQPKLLPNEQQTKTAADGSRDMPDAKTRVAIGQAINRHRNNPDFKGLRKNKKTGEFDPILKGTPRHLELKLRAGMHAFKRADLKTAAVSSRARLALALKGLHPLDLAPDAQKKLRRLAYGPKKSKGMLSIVDPKKKAAGALSLVAGGR
jgi:hypothetical protein